MFQINIRMIILCVRALGFFFEDFELKLCFHTVHDKSQSRPINYGRNCVFKFFTFFLNANTILMKYLYSLIKIFR